MDNVNILFDLYVDLKEKTLKEYEYIKNDIDIDEKKINTLIMNKRVARDRIEKFQKKIKLELSEKQKINISKIINEIIRVEENINMESQKKMNLIRKDIVSTIKEKELRNKYIKSNKTSYFFDEKK